jgi:hypothetical protein
MVDRQADGLLSLRCAREMSMSSDIALRLKRGTLFWLKALLRSARDLLPIVVVIALFQAVVFQRPLEDIGQLLFGLALVVVGLTLFVFGLDLGLFPLGESMAHQFAQRASLPALLSFAFAVGFGTTVAEPALIAVAQKAAEALVHSAGDQGGSLSAEGYAWLLRGTVALSVGCALSLGVLRIIHGWPIQHLVMFGYAVVILLTIVSPSEVVGMAFDAGGVTTSTITVPLATALGVGLASSIRGRNPLVDGFGLIALASLTPIIFVLLLGVACL